jgi:hypothetical protein
LGLSTVVVQRQTMSTAAGCVNRSQRFFVILDEILRLR